MISVLLAGTATALGWSSRASQSLGDIKALGATVEMYHQEHGHWPPDQAALQTLIDTGWWDPDISPEDSWGQPLIYRVLQDGSGFIVYSIGPNGIDDGGVKDDITQHGAQDGHHWKATWPRGRRTIWTGALLGLAVLLLLRKQSMTIRFATAMLLASLGTILGCGWLYYPGVGGSRNGVLAFVRLGAAVVFVLAMIVVVRYLAVRRC